MLHVERIRSVIKFQVIFAQVRIDGLDQKQYTIYGLDCQEFFISNLGRANESCNIVHIG